MDHITVKDLNGLIDHLNRITGHALNPWKTEEDGTPVHMTDDHGRRRLAPNPGTYMLVYNSYGGHSIERMTEAGTTITVMAPSNATKRDLFHRIGAYIEGIQSRPDAHDIGAAILKHAPDTPTDAVLAILEDVLPVPSWLRNMTDDELLESLAE